MILNYPYQHSLGGETQQELALKFCWIILMKYWKLDRVMQKSGVEYNIEEKDTLIQIETHPDNNNTAQENIKSAMKRDEVLINSAPGKFSVIQKDVRVYKKSKEEQEESESK